MKNLIVAGLTQCSFRHFDPNRSTICRERLAIHHPVPSETLIYSICYEDPLRPRLLCVSLAPNGVSSWSEFDLSSVDGWEPSSEENSCVPVGLGALDDGAIVVALRGGMLVEIDNGSGKVVGVVEEARKEYGGVLAMSWSPDSDFVVVVSPAKVMLMTREWDLIAEQESDLASAANISWTGDGESFVVCFKLTNGRTEACVFSRDGLRTAVCDVETDTKVGKFSGRAAVAWEPRTGGFIALSGPGAKVSFFEGNGLHHSRYDFGLCQQKETPSSPPQVLRWSPDSKYLAAVLENSRVVDIYRESNYKWYKKLSFPVKHGVAAIEWDEVVPGSILIISGNGCVSKYNIREHYNVFRDKSSTVFVVEGHKLHFSRFSEGVIPPPFSHDTHFALNSIVDVGQLSLHADWSVCLLADGRVQRLSSQGLEASWWTLKVAEEETSTVTMGKGADRLVSSVCRMRNPLVLRNKYLVIVESLPVDEFGDDSIVVFQLPEDDNTAPEINRIRVGSTISVIAPSLVSPDIVLAASNSGEIVVLDLREAVSENPHLVINSRITGTIAAARAVRISDFVVTQDERRIIVMDDQGHLEVCREGTSDITTISRECSSFLLSTQFLLLTTYSHKLFSILLTKLSGSTEPSNSESGMHIFTTKGKAHDQILGPARPIDRGSLLITNISGDVRYVLQAPRGNLEVIAPREVVLHRVRRLAQDKRYAEAFRLSRQQRIDMNVFVDADIVGFLSKVSDFIAQISNPAHLSVFITFLKGSDEKINQICRVLINEMNSDYRLSPAILTAYLKMSPPNYISALQHVRKCFQYSGDIGNSALDYLRVLAKNDEVLYKQALGIYDLSLAAMVARSSQMDPADYSVELKDLQAQDMNHMKYHIDVKLDRMGSALDHLFKCGEDERETCIQFTIEHKLYTQGFRLFENDPDALIVLREAYAEYLSSVGQNYEAAVMYTCVGKMTQAALCYSKAGMWQQAVSTAVRSKFDKTSEIGSLEALHQHLILSLSELGNFVAAARVQARYQNDRGGALDRLIEAEEWEEALAFASEDRTNSNADNGVSNGVSPLLDKVKEAGVETAETTILDLEESSRKLRERSARLRVVREAKAKLRKKITAGTGDEADSDAFSESTVSTINTSFTFGDSSMMSKTSRSVTAGSEARYRKALAKKHRKANRKRVKEGDPREEEYLVTYLGKLVPGEFLRRRIGKLIRLLGNFGCAKEIGMVQKAMEDVLKEVKQLPEDIKDEKVKNCLEDRSWRLECVV